MSFADILLALLVTAIWGFNFVAIKAGLADLPPLLFVALRFAATALPAVFFVSKKDIKWKYLIGFGLSMGVAQFGFLYVGMSLGMPPGLSSIIVQAQAIFSFILSVLILKDHPKTNQWLGILIGFAGFFIIALNIHGEIKLLAFLFVLFAGLFWAIANIIVKKANTKNMFSFIIWISLIPPIPLSILSLLTESGQLQALAHIGWKAVFAVLYNAWGATIVGYGLWAKLIQKYSPKVVAPFSLLVPIFGYFFAFVFFAERLNLAAIIGSFLVLGGVSLLVFKDKKS